jgi:hypothetical protein
MGDRNSHAKPLRYEPWIDMAGTMSSPRTLFDALFEPRTQIFALHTTNFSIFEKSHIMSNQHHYPASQELYQQAKKLKKDAPFVGEEYHEIAMDPFDNDFERIRPYYNWKHRGAGSHTIMDQYRYPDSEEPYQRVKEPENETTFYREEFLKIAKTPLAMTTNASRRTVSGWIWVLVAIRRPVHHSLHGRSSVKRRSGMSWLSWTVTTAPPTEMRCGRLVATRAHTLDLAPLQALKLDTDSYSIRRFWREGSMCRVNRAMAWCLRPMPSWVYSLRSAKARTSSSRNSASFSTTMATTGTASLRTTLIIPSERSRFCCCDQVRQECF